MHPYSTWFVTLSSILNLLRSSNLRSLIKIFVIWTWDFINFNYTSFFIVHYIIKWHRVSMCLVWSWKTWFFDNKVNDFLIHTVDALLLITPSYQSFFVSLHFSFCILPFIIHPSYSNCLFPFWKGFEFPCVILPYYFYSSSIASFHLWSWIAFSKLIGSQFSKDKKG